MITPTSGSAIAASSAIWPGAAHAISSTSTSVPAGAPRTVSGSPISVLRFSRLATVRRLLAQHRREDVLRRGLAGRAGDADDLGAQLAPPRGGEALQRGERVVGGDDGAGLAQRAASACSGATSTPHAPPASACGREAPAVDVLADAARRTGRRARPRASRSPRARARAVARAPAPRAARRRPAATLLRRPARARSASRATATSSNGHLAAVRELLALLVALAGDHHHVAGRRPARPRARSPRGGRRLARPSRRVHAGHDLGDDRLRVLASAGCRR